MTELGSPLEIHRATPPASPLNVVNPGPLYNKWQEWQFWSAIIGTF